VATDAIRVVRREQSGGVSGIAARLSLLNAIHLITLAVSLGALAWAAIASFWTDRKALHIAAFILAMLAGHAMAIGAIGALMPLHDRYQSRVAWLVPLLAALTLCRLAIKATPSTAR
jgi:hypothetical protein